MTGIIVDFGEDRSLLVNPAHVMYAIATPTKVTLTMLPPSESVTIELPDGEGAKLLNALARAMRSEIVAPQ